ncbi:MAG TPA: TetR/AcrR family transcriptional regulator [Acidimicrobiales bacterium]|nr:TetR/AcrR family transcriptional regulator [Acidimicrobiales bacterium]
MKSKTGKPYSSPLRAEQAAATRNRIVDAAVALLQSDDTGFGMQDVAECAGVAVRTVYRAFPTKDDLLAGVLAAIKERFEASVGLPPTTAEELHSVTGPAVRAVYELEPLYRALFATAAGRESHRRSAGERRAFVEAAFADEIAGLSDEQTQRFTALIHLVTSSSGVLFLKDYAGLDRDAAAATVSWAVAALIAAVRDPEMRHRLEPKEAE